MNKRTTPLPPPSFGDPIWTIEHIALAVRQSVRSARALAATDGFPSPFRLGAASNGRKYWMPAQVLSFLSALTGTADTPALAGPATLREPTVDPAAPSTAQTDAEALLASLPTTRPSVAHRLAHR
ncbi:hypothetical protein [Cellulomonas uda]|nr:hypothetical protein [Cellulomonas uda]NII65556.1 hypothetical protein [Cellulomonas uda]